MSLFKVFEVSGSAVSAQSQRLNVVASNIANAETADPETSNTLNSDMAAPGSRQPCIAANMVLIWWFKKRRDAS